jgi:hypothetical protein
MLNASPFFPTPISGIAIGSQGLDHFLKGFAGPSQGGTFAKSDCRTGVVSPAVTFGDRSNVPVGWMRWRNQPGQALHAMAGRNHPESAHFGNSVSSRSWRAR